MIVFVNCVIFGDFLVGIVGAVFKSNSHIV